MKILNTKSKEFSILLSGFLIVFISCSQNQFARGSHYPELVGPEKTGTLVLFSTEDEQFFNSEKGSIGQAGNREELASRLHMFLSMLEEDYARIEIKNIDIAKDEAAITRFQIYDIPTLILVDKFGDEVKRWVPEDFEITGGSVNTLRKAIDKMINDEERKQSDR